MEDTGRSGSSGAIAITGGMLYCDALETCDSVLSSGAGDAERGCASASEQGGPGCVDLPPGFGIGWGLGAADD